MSRIANPWTLVASFVFGLIGGVLVDRAVGGPGGLAVGIFVLLVPASLAFLGPLGQEYWGQRFSTIAANRERFRDHANLLLNRVLWPVASAVLAYDVDGWPTQTRGTYYVRVPADGGGYASMQSLLQWQSARPHLLAEPTVGPLLLDVEARIQAGQLQKRRLDETFAEKIQESLRSDFGFDFVAATSVTGWSENPPPAMWYPEQIVPLLRRLQAASIGDVQLQPTAINHGTGDPPTSIERINLNGQLALQVTAPLHLDPSKFVSSYNRVRADAALRSAVEGARSTEQSDTEAVRRLASRVWTHGEAVEASEIHMLGVCKACSHLVPR